MSGEVVKSTEDGSYYRVVHHGVTHLSDPPLRRVYRLTVPVAETVAVVDAAGEMRQVPREHAALELAEAFEEQRRLSSNTRPISAKLGLVSNKFEAISTRARNVLQKLGRTATTQKPTATNN